jgi:hypothetical protein
MDENIATCAADGSCPPIVPNAETIETMEEARRGNMKTVTLGELQATLDAED